jgi:pimeloyl-ACP methyl ester carboxylesterase
MAAQYIREIQAVQPKGPYYLIGYCMGGTIALEMALQLRAQGQEIALLVLMETYNWTNMPANRFLDYVYHFIQLIQFNWGRLISGEKFFVRRRIDLIGARIALLFETIKSKLGYKHPQGRGQYTLLYQLEETNDWAAEHYVPKAAYTGRIIQFLPVREYAY